MKQKPPLRRFPSDVSAFSGYSGGGNDDEGRGGGGSARRGGEGGEVVRGRGGSEGGVTGNKKGGSRDDGGVGCGLGGSRGRGEEKVSDWIKGSSASQPFCGDVGKYHLRSSNEVQLAKKNSNVISHDILYFEIYFQGPKEKVKLVTEE